MTPRTTWFTTACVAIISLDWLYFGSMHFWDPNALEQVPGWLPFPS